MRSFRLEEKTISRIDEVIKLYEIAHNLKLSQADIIEKLIHDEYDRLLQMVLTGTSAMKAKGYTASIKNEHGESISDDEVRELFGKED